MRSTSVPTIVAILAPLALGTASCASARAFQQGFGGLLMAGGGVGIAFAIASDCDEYEAGPCRERTEGELQGQAAAFGAGIVAFLLGLVVSSAGAPPDEPRADGDEGADGDDDAGSCGGLESRLFWPHVREAQLRGRPVRVRVLVNPALRELGVWLYYRPVGDTYFRGLWMAGRGCEYVVDLPCADPEPEAWEYYVGVATSRGAPVAHLDDLDEGTTGTPLGPPLRVRLVGPDSYAGDVDAVPACRGSMDWDALPDNPDAPPLEAFDGE